MSEEEKRSRKLVGPDDKFMEGWTCLRERTVGF